MKILAFGNRMHPLPRFVLTRGILLSCALLASALIMLVWADSTSRNVYLLLAYADYTIDMAAAVLGTGLFGSLLLEHVLIHRV